MENCLVLSAHGISSLCPSYNCNFHRLPSSHSNRHSTNPNISTTHSNHLTTRNSSCRFRHSNHPNLNFTCNTHTHTHTP
jgi:hypothetical protein